MVLDIISALLGLACVFFAGKGKVVNFWIGYLYNIFLFFLFLKSHLYSSMLLQPVSLVINVIGHYRWTHPKAGEADDRKALKVSTISGNARIVTVAIVVCMTALWGLVLKNGSGLFPSLFASALHPYLDSFVTVSMFTAQYLSAQKKIECWAVWMVVNITQIILYLFSGLFFMPIVSVAYLILAVLGYKTWRKDLRC